MTLPLTFAATYPGGRILLMLGQHEVGAVFPPCRDAIGGQPWLWRFWLDRSGAKEGRAKTETAAKNAILAEGRDWLRKAGLQDG